MNEAPGLLTVVVPVYNEADVLPEFYRRLCAVLQPLPFRFEVIFVDDGSTDQSAALIQSLRTLDVRLSLLTLSRNFGKEIAMSAGLDHAHGDGVILIDADLQDPPELIPQMISYWAEGYDNVYAKRTGRAGETAVKRGSAHLFYRVINRLSQIDIPTDTGDFRALSRRTVEDLRKLREQHRFMKGLYAWVGHRHKAVPYQREPRRAGHSKWGYWKLWNFALEGITSFSTAPLKLATYLGLLTALVSFCYGLVIIYATLRHGNPVEGWSSLMVVVLFLGGVQLLTLGILGEYLARTFDEVKNRPLYLVGEYLPADLSSAPGKQTPDSDNNR